MYHFLNPIYICFFTGQDSAMTHACFLKTSRTLIACNVFCLSPVIESGVSITIAMTNLYGVLSVQLNFLQCLNADASELQEGRIPTPQCINHQHIEIMLIRSCGDGVVNATHNVTMRGPSAHW